MIKVTYKSNVDCNTKVAIIDVDKEQVVKDTSNDGTKLVDVSEDMICTFGVIADGRDYTSWGTVYHLLMNSLDVPYKETLGLNIEGIEGVPILKLELAEEAE
jgi:hypothetical protein